jgi:dinuclear metal center YbgI/SA1388 family protein
LRRALLTIDLTPDVLFEAIRFGCNLIIAYHPPIFHPTKRFVIDHESQESAAAEALSNRIAIYSPHTRLDSAIGGTNETIAEMCGLRETRPLVPAGCWFKQFKIVVFVPASDVEKVAEAMFEAGAGWIGEYQKCSYRVSGQGTFLGGKATHPRIGQRGRLEQVDEIRLESITAEWNIAEVVMAIRRSHPYEEPAFDIYPLHAVPEQGIGQGRVGSFARATRVSNVARMLKRKTQSRNVTVVGNPAGLVKRAIIVVGAAGNLPFDRNYGGCARGDLVITGEIGHHNALWYQRLSVAAIALGHWASERPVLKPLAARLRKELPGVEFVVSRADRDPFTVVK